MSRLNPVTRRVDALIHALAYPNLYFVIAVTNIVAGVIVIFQDTGTPAAWEQQYGITRLWYPVLCALTVIVLWRWQTPRAFVFASLPAFAMSFGALELARQQGLWLEALWLALLSYLLLLRMVMLADRANGIT